MINITEDNIVQWASSQKAAENLLPELVRRIILGTVDFEEISQIEFGGGKAVGFGDFDGVLDTDNETLFAATQKSVWEVSVREDVKTKANKDYQSRLPEAYDAVTYIALTGRLWAGKKDWAEEKNEEGKWAEVRAYDATDIATWLSAAPAAAVWFSRVLGRPRQGLRSAYTFLQNWLDRTDPVFTPDIPLAGREPEIEKVQNWLAGQPSSISIWAETREEAAIFVLAVLTQGADALERSFLSRTIVVTNVDAWNDLQEMGENTGQPLLLIPLFDEYDGSRSLSKYHHVLMPLEPGQSRAQADLELTPIKRDSLAEALTPLIGDETKAEKMSYDCGGKLTALQRLCGHVTRRPEWADLANPGVRNALLLASAWDPREPGDQQILSKLAGGEAWENVERQASQLMSCPDAPVRTFGTAIKFRSPNDAWNLLATDVTATDIERFESVCKEVLTQDHPKYDLAPEERWCAAIKGAKLKVSGNLREGLCDSLAWLALNEERIDPNIRPRTVGSTVAVILREVLNHDWKRWASLGNGLQAMAEADPDEFLDALQDAASAEDSTLGEIFAQDIRGSMTTGCPHASLLRALEILAWHEDYFSWVVNVLADLTESDEGGQYLNRPINTLKSLFGPTLRVTALSHSGRETVLRKLCENRDPLGWEILTSLHEAFESAGWMVDLSPRPRFRDWDIPGKVERYTPEEQIQYYRCIHRLTLESIGTDTRRLKYLVWPGGIHALDANEFLEQVKTYVPSLRSFGDDFLIEFQQKLRQALCCCERKEKEELCKVLKEACRILEPKSLHAKYAWLFAPHVDIPGFDSDWRAKAAEVKRLRYQTLDELLAEDNSLELLLELVGIAASPRSVGFFLGSHDDSDPFEEEVNRFVVCDDPRRQEFAKGFWLGKVQNDGTASVLAQIDNSLSMHGPEWCATIVAAFRCEPEIRDWVFSKENDLQRFFWEKVSMGSYDFRDSADFARTIDAMLAAHRWDLALDAADWAILHDKVGEAETFLAVLRHGRQANEKEQELAQRELHGSIPAIFKKLDEFDGVDKDELASLEIFYLKVLDHSDRPPRYLAERLATAPDFFVDLICVMTKPHHALHEDETAGMPEEEKKQRSERARIAYDILHNWKTYPGYGMPPDSGDEVLRSWCETAKGLCEEADRAIAGKHRIGEVLARVPAHEEDGIWPCKVARDYIETGEGDIARGIELARLNSRGVTSRAPDAGGTLERDLVEKYRQDANTLKIEYPGTARFLRRMADHYDNDARRHDDYAEPFRDP